MKNIIGQVARKDSFLERKGLIQKIYRRLEANSNLYISGPRRVGKTSILFSLVDNESENIEFLYVNTEGVIDSKAFFDIILKNLQNSKTISNLKREIYEAGEKIIDKFNIDKKIGVLGVGLRFEEMEIEDEMIHERLKNIVSEVNIKEKKIVIIIDEFPYTVENILINHGEAEARHFLQLNREIRQSSNGQILFIYSGSSSIRNLSNKFNVSSLINDLSIIDIPPLTREEAKALAKGILQTYHVNISDKPLEYLISEIGMLTPFFVQLIISELIDLSEISNVNEIETKHIDIAINNLSSQRNSIYFEHYFHHIKRACANEQEFNFVFKLLNLISTNKGVSLKDIEILAKEEKIQFTYLNTIDWLQLDGYLIFDDKQQFTFSSNLLFNWWKKNFVQTHNNALPKTAAKARRSKPT